MVGHLGGLSAAKKGSEIAPATLATASAVNANSIPVPDKFAAMCLSVGRQTRAG
jgi:hypothetical protein